VRLADIAYTFPAGPVAPLDMVYGFRPELARGNLFMAHRTGFTARTRSNARRHAGFAQVHVKRIARLGLWAVAGRQVQSDERLASLSTAVFPSEKLPLASTARFRPALEDSTRSE